ncbi:MAG: translational GTPase TypA [Deltaproteobacteria bacterium]|nr:translational GTPase TypA [Deltaproteobacteria bacterium]
MAKDREFLRNVAIIAHVDHGKTTLVDALFHQGGLFRENEQVAERMMDSNDQERERGITILAKATSVQFGDYKLQIVDTPGHADFGGEVERTLRMVDGVLLLVDAAEGPLPQTRFVLRKAFALSLPVAVAINKIDRGDARPSEVLDEIYDLFIDIGADEEQLEFPVLYTNGRAGTATLDLDVPGTDMKPLVDALIETVPAPADRSEEPFVMQVNQLGYDEYVGRLVIGRIHSGSVKPNQMVRVMREDGHQDCRITGVFAFQGVKRLPLEEAKCADIVALSGIENVAIGDTLSDPQEPKQLPPIHVDEPTVAIIFQVNNGPLAGKSGGQFLTSRHIRERLNREAYANVSIRIEDGDSPEQFRVLGRGELQLSVLMETLRREKFELCVRNPEVVTREGENGQEEPRERLNIDVDVAHVGAVTQLLGNRKAQMLDQKQEGSRVRLEYLIPTRGLFGLRGQMLTATRGTAIMHHVFEDWIPWTGPIPQRISGAMVADRPGSTTGYALNKMQPRGILFAGPGVHVYEGMIVGIHNRDNDLDVNVVREKKLTNFRASGKDDAIQLAPPKEMSLEQSLEWIRDDEMIEVTPEAIRLRKIVLSCQERHALSKKLKDK